MAQVPAGTDPESLATTGSPASTENQQPEYRHGKAACVGPHTPQKMSVAPGLKTFEKPRTELPPRGSFTTVNCVTRLCETMADVHGACRQPDAFRAGCQRPHRHRSHHLRRRHIRQPQSEADEHRPCPTQLEAALPPCHQRTRVE